MNNIKYYSDNLAHDFDMFMPKPKKNIEDNVIQMPEKKRVNKTSDKTQAKASAKSSVFSIVVVAFIIAAVFGNIFLRAEISKVGNEINSAEIIAQQLKSEQTRLNVELEKKTSVGNLKKQANKLGMQKQEKSQMNYVFFYGDENIEESADVN